MSTEIGSFVASARAVTCAATSSSVVLPSLRARGDANPELVGASAWNPNASRTRAEPASHGFGMTNGSPSCSARNASALPAWLAMLLQPCFRNAFLGPGQPGLGDHLFELLAVEPFEIRYANQNGRVALEVRRREVDPAGIGQQQFFHVQVFNAEHEDVVQPLTCLRVHRVRPPPAVDQATLAVAEGARPAVVRDLLRRL